MKTREHAVLAILAGLLLSPCAARESGPAAPIKPAEIPFSLEEGNIVVQAELAPGHPLPFVFDSGLSEGNLVTQDAAKALGLKSAGSIRYQGANGSGGAAALATIPSIRVGDVTLTGQPAAIAAIPPEVTTRPGQPSLAGFLGAPLLKDAVLCIDYEHTRMQRWKRTEFPGGRLSETPMPLRHGLPTMDVKIDGRPATLVIDTGSNAAITLFPAFLAKEGVGERYGHFATRDVEADAVEFGDGSGFNHVPLSAGAQALDPAWGIDGLVGSAVLSQLNPCLDRDGQRILWMP